jgi:DNA polymerase I-like protein with 3'-5' exonuclease and polymerase domains
MISDYNTKDIYMTIAIKSGAAPKGAIKASHPVIRNNYKVVLLATLYGQGAKSLAAQLDISIDEAVKIQQDIKNRFCIYFEWIDSLVNRAMVRGYMSTKFGWRYWISKEDKINPRSLFNFPIQAHGSEMLRLALIGLVKEDIEVNALIHDGIIVQCKSNKFHDTEKKVSQIMENASRLVMDGNVCPVDITPIKSNFKQDKEEQIKFERMMTIIRHPSNKSTGVVA